MAGGRMIAPFAFDQRMTIYTPNETDGRHDVVIASDRPCRLAIVGGGELPETADGRVTQTGVRRLMWHPSLAMPEDAQIEVDGQRWNIHAGTMQAVRGISGAVVYQRCDVTKVIS